MVEFAAHVLSGIALFRGKGTEDNIHGVIDGRSIGILSRVTDGANST
jgi:hypothetical protein